MGRLFVIFQLEGLFCALPSKAVSEILPVAEFFRPPQMPSILEGFLNLEGEAIPVLRLGRLLVPGNEKGAASGLYSHLILIRSKLRALLLEVEKALEVKDLPDQAFLPFDSGHSLGGCVEAQAEEGGRKIYVLSPERLFLREEEERVAGLQVLEQERLQGLAAPPE